MLFFAHLQSIRRIKRLSKWSVQQLQPPKRLDCTDRVQNHMTKRKKRLQRVTHRKQPQVSAKKSSRKLLHALAGLAVIALTVAGIGWYIEKHRTHIREEWLATLEKRVNSSSAWGRKVSQWVEAQRTSIKHDSSVFAPMWYSVRNDTIFINDDLYTPIKVQVKAAQKGDLYAFIMRFHEELHRAQERKSKWGALWRATTQRLAREVLGE